MGGLKKKMPITFITFAVATIAIAGIPPLAGFFSKDEILWKAFSSDIAVGKLVWGIGIVTAFITAFYMFRLLFLTFFGEYKGHHHVHESPLSMVFALVVLAILSFIGGWVGVPDALGESVLHTKTNKFEHFLEKSINPVAVHEGNDAHDSKGEHAAHHEPAEFILMAVSILIAASGIYLAFHLYRKKTGLPATIAARFPDAHNLIYNKYFVDEKYNSAIIQPLITSSVHICRFDNNVVDGSVNTVAYSTGDSSKYVGVFDNDAVDAAVNGVANEVYATGGQLRQMQSGNIKLYLSIAVLSSVVIMAILWSILEWKQVKDFLVSLGLL
jgi:NADH-quinone oxidoreductase subunit L